MTDEIPEALQAAAVWSAEHQHELTDALRDRDQALVVAVEERDRHARRILELELEVEAREGHLEDLTALRVVREQERGDHLDMIAERNDAWRTIDQLRTQLHAVTAERDTLNTSLEKAVQVPESDE